MAKPHVAAYIQKNCKLLHTQYLLCRQQEMASIHHISKQNKPVKISYIFPFLSSTTQPSFYRGFSTPSSPICYRQLIPGSPQRRCISSAVLSQWSQRGKIGEKFISFISIHKHFDFMVIWFHNFILQTIESWETIQDRFESHSKWCRHHRLITISEVGFYEGIRRHSRTSLLTCRWYFHDPYAVYDGCYCKCNGGRCCLWWRWDH